jgi:FkbM family methyltransferase
MSVKNFARRVLQALHLDLTKNLKYDRLTGIILKNSLQPNSNCIDIGCHKGEVIEFILKYAPAGNHFAFEPIPFLYQGLVEKQLKNVNLYPYALSETAGDATFHWVKNAPAYSGLKKRTYDIPDPEIEKIDVELRRLDDVIPEDQKIDLIKIDVEGAELQVLKGGIETIRRNRPIIIFEFGLGASDHYGAEPEDIFHLIHNQCGLNIYTLDRYLNKQSPLTLDKLAELYATNSEYYFVAAGGTL